VFNELAAKIRADVSKLEKDLEDIQEQHGEMLEEQRREARLRLLAAQINAVRRAADIGVASEETVRELLTRLYERYGVQPPRE
jgi:septal ring factor EnvC (AmiA/AmiB activator)